ncbi:MAG: hypothetical protein KBT73_11245 [Marinobacter sp.]|nr:hypothetical protein [Marinobacter sp.]
MQADSPYPNPFEILRCILRALDLKQSNKRLDELAGKGTYDPRELRAAVETDFFVVTKKFMGPVTAEATLRTLNRFLEKYLHQIVGRIPADGLTRESVLKILIKTCIKDGVTELMGEIHEEVGGPHPSIWFSSHGSTVGKVLAWIDEKTPQWSVHLSSLKKERKDMISSWNRGIELPSSRSILLLSETDTSDRPVDVNWEKIKTLLFISRAIDFIKGQPLGPLLLDEARLALWGADDQVSVGSAIKMQQEVTQRKLGPEIRLIARLQNDLRRTVKKREPGTYRIIIDQVREQILASNVLLSTQYWIDWHDARWHVFAGDLQNASELYKCAFYGALFCAGDNQRLIAEESISVAACLPNPDRVFLKQLKWSLINFGYDIPSIRNNKPSQKVTDTIEDWEMDLWKSGFSTVFPKDGLFPGVDHKISQVTIGPLVFTDISKIKPDYRNVNRNMKVGETWQRVMPQLVWFAINEDVSVCKKLIEKGADVNVSSEVGDTPILMALEALNITEVNEANLVLGGPLYRTLDDQLFHFLKDIPHNPNTLNKRTQKKRLLPIISAVESGRVDVVQAVLSMGADPRGRGKTDEQTALNVCLKLIGIVKNPELSKKHQMSMPITPEALDSIRRQAQGMSGFTMEQQKRSLLKNTATGLSKIAAELFLDAMYKNILENTSAKALRKIAMLLIESGADVDAEHASPIKGYTPLMLAVELDERELFDAMVVAGADIQKTFKDPKDGHDVSIAEIAREFESTNVSQSLDNISRYVTVH